LFIAKSTNGHKVCTVGICARPNHQYSQNFANLRIPLD
jgi:hypothetical protein